VNVAGATKPVGCSDYKILLKVTSTDGLLVGGPFVDAIAPDVSGNASFDISGLVDQPMDKVFEWPLIGGLNPYSAQTYDIKFTPGERYIDSNGDIQSAYGADSETNYIVKGGVSFNALGIYYDETNSFYDEFVTGMKFLTRFPTSQVVHPYQPVKMWLLSPSANSTYINIKAHYDDGSIYHYTASTTLYKEIIHEINCLPYHADSANMPPVKNDSSKMSKYEVWIGGMSVHQMFVVDHNYHENCNYLFFANSLGGIDCVWLSGHVEKGFSSEMVTAIKPWTATSGAKNRTKIISNRAGRRTWKINTGWKSIGEMTAMSDMLLSRQVWLLEDAGVFNEGTIYPVIITNSSSLLMSTMKDLNELELELEEAHDNAYL
jgi:hypothetical protein